MGRSEAEELWSVAMPWWEISNYEIALHAYPKHVLLLVSQDRDQCSDSQGEVVTSPACERVRYCHVQLVLVSPAEVFTRGLTFLGR